MFFYLMEENISHIVSAVGTEEEAISTKGETEEWHCYNTAFQIQGIQVP